MSTTNKLFIQKKVSSLFALFTTAATIEYWTENVDISF